jgi:cysteine desulfurase
VLVHADAVQSLGKIPVNVNELGVNLMTISAHKLYGPKGIGALYIRRGSEIEPLLQGGGQERGTRPGTENVPLAVGFAKAVDLAIAGMEEESSRLARLRDVLESRIRAGFPAAIINGHPTNRLPHILNISFDSTRTSLEGDVLLMSMDLRGIAVASGSACTSGSVQPSHVLLAMGRDEKTAKASLRFSFGRDNLPDDVIVVVASLRSAVGQTST